LADDDTMTTLAIGEEDGTPDGADLYVDDVDWSRLKPGRPGDGDDWATTLAVGEEGEPDPEPIEVTTMAIGEEGDPCLLEPEPIEMTTTALAEEGDDGCDIYM
jgi:hypothetical protein